MRREGGSLSQTEQTHHHLKTVVLVPSVCVCVSWNLRSVRPISHACLTPVLPHELTLNSFGCSAAVYVRTQTQRARGHNYIQQTIRTRLGFGCRICAEMRKSKYVLLFQTQDAVAFAWDLRFTLLCCRVLKSCHPLGAISDAKIYCW